jgi:hypothetical protein
MAYQVNYSKGPKADISKEARSLERVRWIFHQGKDFERGKIFRLGPIA